MKSASPLLPSIKVSLMAMLIMLAGCAQTLRIKVVDAAEQQPLDDVQMTWIRVRPGFLKDFSSRSDQMSLSKSAEGIAIRNVSTGGNHTFTFTRPGYHKATLVYHHGKGFIDSPDFLKPGDAVRRTSFGLTNPIVVPLHRISDGH